MKHKANPREFINNFFIFAREFINNLEKLTKRVHKDEHSTTSSEDQTNKIAKGAIMSNSEIKRNNKIAQTWRGQNCELVAQKGALY